MSDEFDYDDDDIDAPEVDESPRGLRQAAKRAKADRQELAAAKRELALVKAGVDTDTKVGKLFAKAYDGDLDVDKIKAEWAEIAPSTTPAPEPTFDEPAVELQGDEAASTAQRQALANNAPADVPTADADPRTKSVEVMEQIVHNGGSTDEALATAFDFLAGAAAGGDDRGVIKAWQG